MYTFGMDWNNNSLKMLNLSAAEIAILNSLEEPRNVQGIVRATSLSRTGINHAIRGLIAKGLVEHQSIGKRRSYIAISLERLTQKLKEALGEIEIANKDKKGVKIKVSREDEFIIHIGAREIVPAYARIASENKNERIRAIQHYRSFMEIVEKASSTLIGKFNEAIKSNQIILDGLINESAYRKYAEDIKRDPKKFEGAIESLEGRMADYHVFPDNVFNYDAEIWLFKTTTLIINWKEEVAIEITNSNMTGFLKDMFSFVKAGGRKIDHNKAMRDIIERK